jgi:hypothetical protein
MYVVWTIVSALAVCALLFARGRKARIGRAVVWCAMMYFVLYGIDWVATVHAIYPDASFVHGSTDRLRNVGYVVASNFREGQFLSGTRALYMVILMPAVQALFVVLTLPAIRGNRA